MIMLYFMIFYRKSAKFNADNLIALEPIEENEIFLKRSTTPL